MKSLILALLFICSTLISKAQKPVTYISVFTIDSVWVGIGPLDKPMYQFEDGKKITHYPIGGSLTVFSSQSVGSVDHFIIREPVLNIMDTVFFKIIRSVPLDSGVVLTALGNKGRKRTDTSVAEFTFHYIIQGTGLNRRLVVIENDFPTKRNMYFLTRREVITY